jgi:hypothetical protein
MSKPTSTDRDLFGVPIASPVLRRVVNASVEIQQNEPDRMDFMHAVICQVGMPRKKVVKFQQRYQMRHRNFAQRGPLPGGPRLQFMSPVGSTPSPPHSLSGGMIALNHPDRSVR